MELEDLFCQRRLSERFSVALAVQGLFPYGLLPASL